MTMLPKSTRTKLGLVIDLDTCMPAWSLYDFGDLVRFTAATSPEDETDLDRVGSDLDQDTLARVRFLRSIAYHFLQSPADALGDDLDRDLRALGETRVFRAPRWTDRDAPSRIERLCREEHLGHLVVCGRPDDTAHLPSWIDGSFLRRLCSGGDFRAGQCVAGRGTAVCLRCSPGGLSYGRRNNDGLRHRRRRRLGSGRSAGSGAAVAGAQRGEFFIHFCQPARQRRGLAALGSWGSSHSAHGGPGGGGCCRRRACGRRLRGRGRGRRGRLRSLTFHHLVP